MSNCQGDMIPQYKQVREMRLNPFYCGVKLPKIGNFGHLNTTDEFIVTVTNVEIGSICADCKQTTCKEDYAKREK